MDEAKLVKWINELIAKDELWRFYKHELWSGSKRKKIKGLKNEVLEEQHCECRICKEERADVTTATTVHHMKEVKKFPALALSRFYYDEQGIRQLNLIAICDDCHNKIHKRFGYEEKIYLNEEKW